MPFTWFRSPLPARSRRGPRYRPYLEALEGRDAPAVGTWTPLGPFSVDAASTGHYGPVAGRVNVAVAVPGDPNVVYVGTNDSGTVGNGSSTGGGVWMTTDFLDASPHWTPLTDNQPSGSIYVHGLTMSPFNSQVLYAAAQGPDGGILRSFDGGATWTYLAEDIFANVSFGAIVASPNQPGTVYVAVDGGMTSGSNPVKGGVFQSTDYGTTWHNVSAGSFAGAVTDLAIVPNPNPQSPVPDTLYAGVIDAHDQSGIWVSTNSGTSWQHQTTGFLNAADVTEYVALALAPSNPSVIYAAVFDNADLSGPNDDPTPKLFGTTNGGTSWAPLPSPTPGSKGIEYRYWHLVLGVDPLNANYVYTNTAYEFHFSDDGGKTWGSSFFNSDDPVSVYFNGVGTAKDGSGVMLVGDRGINFRPDLAATVVPRAGDLANLLIYNVGFDPNNPADLFATSQDQLNVLRDTGNPQWIYVPVGSEVGKLVIDPTNSDLVYNLGSIMDQSTVNKPGSQQFMQRSTDGGSTWMLADNGLNPLDFPMSAEFEQNVYNSLAIDPTHPNRLIMGSDRVYQTLDGATTWTPISPPLAPLGGGEPGTLMSDVALAPSDARVIYAATIDGQFFATFDGGASWLVRDAGLPADEDSPVLQIRVDPRNANRVFVVTGGTSTTGKVWLTTDGGQSWQNLTGNLPPTFEVFTVAVDWRYELPLLYVGTSRNAFVSANLGGSWTVFGSGLPNTEVRDLELSPQFNLLIAATYGRSVWQTTIQPPAPPIFAVGAGIAPEVKVYQTGSGAQLAAFFAFDPQFTGGVRVAVGDVNGDGIPDVIAGSGPGQPAEVKVFSGQNGAVLYDFYAFGAQFTDGVFVAAGDVNRDGAADIIVGADAGGAPEVKVFGGGSLGGQQLLDFLVFGAQFTGGVRVGSADVNGDFYADLIVGAGVGGAPEVKVYSGQGNGVLFDFLAYTASFSGGVYVAGGDVNGDGKADLITGAGASILSVGPQVRVFSGQDASLLQSFFAFNPLSIGGVRVAAVAFQPDKPVDLLVGAGPFGGPQVRVLDTFTLKELDNFFAFDPFFLGGVFVGG